MDLNQTGADLINKKFSCNQSDNRYLDEILLLYGMWMLDLLINCNENWRLSDITTSIDMKLIWCLERHDETR